MQVQVFISSANSSASVFLEICILVYYSISIFQNIATIMSIFLPFFNKITYSTSIQVFNVSEIDFYRICITSLSKSVNYYGNHELIQMHLNKFDSNAFVKCKCLRIISSASASAG